MADQKEVRTNQKTKRNQEDLKRNENTYEAANTKNKGGMMGYKYQTHVVCDKCGACWFGDIPAAKSCDCEEEVE